MMRPAWDTHGAWMGIPPRDAVIRYTCEHPDGCKNKAVAVCTKHDYQDNDVWCGVVLCRRHYLAATQPAVRP